MAQKILKKHYEVLLKLREGNHLRYLTVNTSYTTKDINPFSLDELAASMNMEFDDVCNIAANLISMGYAETITQKPSFVQKMIGREEEILWFPSDLGESFLKSHKLESIPEDEPLAEKKEATAEDYREAKSVLEDIYSDNNFDIYCDDERKIKWAKSLFDSDIIEEIKISCDEMDKMYLEFKRKFGHDLPARNDEEAAFRDPIVISLAVRKFRALDEQLRRVNLPESEKPRSWNTHFKGGNIDLPKPLWD